MSSEIVIPFALSPTGGIAVTTDPDVQTGQHVDSLVSTRPGERVMVPTYGVDLAGQLFGNTGDVGAAVVNDVKVAMGKWEPSVIVVNVSLVDSLDQTTGLTQVEVDYATPSGGATNPGTSTATVLVGGTVIEEVSP